MIKVAIAEDDYRVALLHERYLDDLKGIQVIGRALNIKETFELLSNNEVDLLLLDIYFPDALGTEALPMIRKKFAHLDIIMITASADKKMLDTSRRYGASHYLLKPVTRDKFQHTINKYLEQAKWFHDEKDITQLQADALFEGNTAEIRTSNLNQLPTGIDAITLEKVRNVFKSTSNGMNTEEICRTVGISRTTARRYLEYLVSISECETIINYGEIGRPERLYQKR